MNCEIIKDLIMPYIDNCCSDESSEIVKKHLEVCDDCKAFYEKMTDETKTIVCDAASYKFNRINEHKASVLQSVLLYASFALIVIGVAIEASVPSGFTNGVFAFGIVVPSTGFMLSLSNWYFVRLYKNKNKFSNYSLLSNIAFTLCGFIFTCFHYDLFDSFATTIKEMQFSDLFDMLSIFGIWIGIFMTTVFCLVSKNASAKYAQMLGKE